MDADLLTNGGAKEEPPL